MGIVNHEIVNAPKNYLEDQNNGKKFKNIDECLNNKMNDVYTSTENLSIRSILEGKTPPKRRRMSRKFPRLIYH